jgi:hypothetical protein
MGTDLRCMATMRPSEVVRTASLDRPNLMARASTLLWSDANEAGAKSTSCTGSQQAPHRSQSYGQKMGGFRIRHFWRQRYEAISPHILTRNLSSVLYLVIWVDALCLFLGQRLSLISRPLPQSLYLARLHSSDIVATT